MRRATCCLPSLSERTKPQSIGLVSHRAAPGELDRKLRDVVAALLAKPAEALRLTQGLLRLGTRDEILERMKEESSLFAERLTSDEVKQAISAFFEKRTQAAERAD